MPERLAIPEMTLDRQKIVDDYTARIELSPQALSNCLQYFERPQQIEHQEVFQDIRDMSPALTELYTKRTGLTTIEQHSMMHAQGVETYIDALRTPQARQMARFFSLFHDIGKGLGRELEDTNRGQDKYNRVFVERILSFASDEAMTPDTKATLQMLMNQDIIGRAVRGASDAPNRVGVLTIEEAQAEMNVFLGSLPDSIPLEVKNEVPKLMEICYMADITTYSSYRTYVDHESGEEHAGPTEMDDNFELIDGKLAVKAPVRQVIHDVVNFDLVV